jgi:hypothetical protein
MLVSQFEGIKMQEDEPFNEFYTKISNLRNFLGSLGKKISDAKLIKKILRSLPEHFRIKKKSHYCSSAMWNMRLFPLSTIYLCRRFTKLYLQLLPNPLSIRLAR